uniref:40S ribosomal protein S15 n=1 Tax=Calidris pygmaea TaxID=425635 RepID=A0A8C3KEJ9_9CHAR
MAEVEQKKKRTFRKFTYRGVDLDQLLDMSYEQLMQLYSARQRRRLNRGLRRKQHSLLKRLRKAKKEAPPMEKPEVVKTHLRDMIILPEMVGSMVGVYNGKTFNQVEIKVRRPHWCPQSRVLARAELPHLVCVNCLTFGGWGGGGGVGRGSCLEQT